MKEKIKICALFALLMTVNCVQVFDNTTSSEASNDDRSTKSLDYLPTSPESFHQEEDKKFESETIPEYLITTAPSSTTTHKIPPTLINTKLDAIKDIEKSGKIVNDVM
jgi:hypothetical protein